MRLIFAGTPEFAVPSLRALAAAGHEIVGVITREDAPIGRKRVLTPSPVAVAGEELGLEVLRTNRLDSAATDWARERVPELGVIVAYGGLVREPLLSLPQHGWINLHFSDLPRWRGAAPVQRALMAGEQELGVTVFRLVAELDAGAVLTRGTRSFPPGTPAGAALTALSECGTGPLLDAIDRLAADPDAGSPQTGETSYADKLTRADGRLDLSAEAARVLAHWAGVTPAPGAYALAGEEPVKLLELAPAEAGPDAVPGRAEIVSGAAVLALPGSAVGTVTALELRRVQPAGKAAMDGAAWLRGRGGSTVLS